MRAGKGERRVLAKAIHTMIRVLDLDRTISFYREAFGLEEADRFDFDDFTLVYLSNDEDDFEVELTLNKGQTEPYDLGNGYGHLAVSVDDVDSEHQRFTDAGFEPRRLVTLEKDGEALGKFFFVADPDGYQIEVLQRGGRYK
jgi:lactoylglutathione lyase